MIAICGTNALPTMAPWGGTDKLVGLNPIAVAIPSGRGGADRARRGARRLRARQDQGLRAEGPPPARGLGVRRGRAADDRCRGRARRADSTDRRPQGHRPGHGRRHSLDGALGSRLRHRFRHDARRRRQRRRRTVLRRRQRRGVSRDRRLQGADRSHHPPVQRNEARARYEPRLHARCPGGRDRRAQSLRRYPTQRRDDCDAGRNPHGSSA